MHIYYRLMTRQNDQTTVGKRSLTPPHSKRVSAAPENIRFETAQTLTLTYIILTFTFFPFTQLGKTVFYLHVRPSDARMRHRQKDYGSVESRNTTFRLAQIQVSATSALKFDRTSGSKPHNINFHVFFDNAPGITCFLYLHELSFDTRVSHW